MKSFFNKIKNSEFLTFNEVLRLKVAIVTVFLFVFVFLSIPLSGLDDFEWSINLLVPMGFGFGLVLTFLLTLVNFNRSAMHVSIWIIIGLTLYYVYGSNYFFSYILFFVSLTIIIFYQDILTYILYGGAITGFGMLYIATNGSSIVGMHSTSVGLSSLTYQVILVGFYIVFLIQFLVSDNIYERLNNEWVRMNKILERYQDFTHSHLLEIVENSTLEPVYKSTKFQQAINELSCFMNEHFEEKGDNIAEVVEFYFFIHDTDVEAVIDDKELPLVTRKYAMELKKYLLNVRSELVSILFDFSTLFKGDEDYDITRYEYSLDELFKDRIDKLLSLSILYKFLKTEITQYDKWGKIDRALTHDEITDLFVSKEFREFISFEQVNFFLDNQELFDKYL